MISLRGVDKSYDGGVSFVVRGLTLEISEGETLVLLGSSGCGKTTILKMVNRLIDPTAGEIRVNGKDVMDQDPVALRRSIGYVFQGVGLFPHMTVAENVGIVPRLLGWADGEISARVDELLDLVGLPPADYRSRRPGDLSGGEGQRVGVARALAARSKVMLMDEPFGALDPLTREGLQAEYRKIHRALGLTTVMVTHDMSEALLVADRIAVMAAGRILQVGTPRELLANPHDDFVRRLIETPKNQAARFDALSGDGDDTGE